VEKAMGLEWREFELNGRTYCGASVEIRAPAIDLGEPVRIPADRSPYICPETGKAGHASPAYFEQNKRGGP